MRRVLGEAGKVCTDGDAHLEGIHVAEAGNGGGDHGGLGESIEVAVGGIPGASRQLIQPDLDGRIVVGRVVEGQVVERVVLRGRSRSELPFSPGRVHLVCHKMSIEKSSEQQQLSVCATCESAYLCSGHCIQGDDQNTPTLILAI